uniref:Uncharacterized protein n=1 Tax=Streptomyces sp. NBC_00003 TaxID=2903608 RepID=A0AAU2V7M4_9ACTN
MLTGQQLRLTGRLELLGGGDMLPVVRTAVRLLGDVPDRLLPFAEADLVRPSVVLPWTVSSGLGCLALLRHRDLAVA